MSVPSSLLVDSLIVCYGMPSGGGITHTYLTSFVPHLGPVTVVNDNTPHYSMSMECYSIDVPGAVQGGQATLQLDVGVGVGVELQIYGIGLKVLDTLSGVNDPRSSGPHARDLLRQNAPNPFDRSTEISYVLSLPGRTAVQIYDASGRLVRTMTPGYQDPGERREGAGAQSNHPPLTSLVGRNLSRRTFFWCDGVPPGSPTGRPARSST
jgi:hypothetical protein